MKGITMKKFIKPAVLVLAILIIASSSKAFAEAVYTTANGSKYHKETCALIKNKGELSSQEKKEAQEKGYTPCKRCYKEELIADGTLDVEANSVKK